MSGLKQKGNYSYFVLGDLTKQFLYPAGEPHIELLHPEMLPDVIECSNVRNFNDLCLLKALDREYKRIHGRGPQWFIPYFPFSRHDRRRYDGDINPLHLALELVSDMNVLTVDPHSDVSGVLSHIDQATCMKFLFESWALEPDAACLIPDQGAEKKQLGYVGSFFQDVARGYKHRDPKTGKLSCFEVDSLPDPSVPVYIIDDICDGGGTFLGLSDAMSDKGYTGPRVLIVTHGLFTNDSQLDNGLRSVFSNIITFGPEMKQIVHYVSQLKCNRGHRGAPINVLAWRYLYHFWATN